MSEIFDRIHQELEKVVPLENVTPFDTLGLHNPLRKALNHAYRAGQVTVAELAESMGLELTEAELIARQGGSSFEVIGVWYK